jgi:membrane protease subunit HflK
MLEEYERAPAVTRERLYLETIERVLESSKKVVLDTQGGAGNLVYLPIDKLLEQGRRVPRVSTSEPSVSVESTEGGDATGVTGERRTRGSR